MRQYQKRVGPTTNNYDEQRRTRPNRNNKGIMTTIAIWNSIEGEPLVTKYNHIFAQLTLEEKDFAFIHSTTLNSTLVRGIRNYIEKVFFNDLLNFSEDFKKHKLVITKEEFAEILEHQSNLTELEASIAIGTLTFENPGFDEQVKTDRKSIDIILRTILGRIHLASTKQIA